MPTTLRSTDILFNDGTTQSTAATGTSTAFGAVGTYAVLMNAANANLATGSTIAGSSLRYEYTPNTINSTSVYNTFNPFVGSQQQVNNPTYGGGGAALSGTWRKMSAGTIYTVFYCSCGVGSYIYAWGQALYVRIA